MEKTIYYVKGKYQNVNDIPKCYELKPGETEKFLRLKEQSNKKS